MLFFSLVIFIILFYPFMRLPLPCPVSGAILEGISPSSAHVHERVSNWGKLPNQDEHWHSMTRHRVIRASSLQPSPKKSEQKIITKSHLINPNSMDSLRSPALCHLPASNLINARSRCAEDTSPLQCHASSPRNTQRRSVASHRE